MGFRDALKHKDSDSKPDDSTLKTGTSPGKDGEMSRPFRRSLDPSDVAQTEGRLRRWSRLRSSSGGSEDSAGSRSEKRLSSLLNIRPSSQGSRSSPINVPSDLPDINDTGETDDKEAQWEKRATILAQSSSFADTEFPRDDVQPENSAAESDLQTAIELHEAGKLGESTAILSKLADPHGANNALAQVLYGLALRHGWGVKKDPNQAVTFLSRAASNSALIEVEALNAGQKKGGVAKGELVLAIFELANCFRNGWGVDKDPVAARRYYETAANLGDSDAMNEAARCYEEGIGGKKDKFMAAKYYRKAEDNGNKTLGNSWIWKEKYNP